MSLISKILPMENVLLDAESSSKKRVFERVGLLFENSQQLARSQVFDSLFARVLDRDENALTFLAMDAKRLGLLDIKSGGGMMVVSFDAILTEKEKRLIHGTH